jgi:uncharacterized Zn finger protein
MTNLQVEQREWWVERWLELLDSYRFKKRLERARTYSREGNVLSIDFVDAEVLAKVQGSEIEPYQVSLSLDAFSAEDWQYVVNSLAAKAIFSAQLLAGQMPDDIERVFIDNGLSLFPFSLSDVHSRCSCPDQANPCKHIGAVYYSLGDRFSEDPFVIFQLRGRTKNQILEALREHRGQETTTEILIPVTRETSAQVRHRHELSRNRPMRRRTDLTQIRQDAKGWAPVSLAPLFVNHLGVSASRREKSCWRSVLPLRC